MTIKIDDIFDCRNDKISDELNDEIEEIRSFSKVELVKNTEKVNNYNIYSIFLKEDVFEIIDLLPKDIKMEKDEQEALERLNKANLSFNNVIEFFKGNTEFLLKSSILSPIIQDFVDTVIKKLYEVFPEQVKNSIEKNIDDHSKNHDVEPFTNDLGLPMHPLEVEIATMVSQADRLRKGEKLKEGEENILPPDYKKAKLEDSSIKTPVDYLKVYYGKYLSRFGAEADYLYQSELNAIDPKFRNNLRMYLSNHEEDISDYVPNISVKVDKEAQAIEKLGLKNATTDSKRIIARHYVRKYSMK